VITLVATPLANEIEIAAILSHQSRKKRRANLSDLRADRLPDQTYKRRPLHAG
jgi:hypothetical protein